MSEALRNFLYEKDPLGKGLDFVVDQHELEALLEAHKVEIDALHEGELADLEQDLASLHEALETYECIDDHCEDHLHVCPECDAETT